MLARPCAAQQPSTHGRLPYQQHTTLQQDVEPWSPAAARFGPPHPRFLVHPSSSTDCRVTILRCCAGPRTHHPNHHHPPLPPQTQPTPTLRPPVVLRSSSTPLRLAHTEMSPPSSRSAAVAAQPSPLSCCSWRWQPRGELARRLTCTLQSPHLYP